MTRFRVPVGFELTAESADEAYLAVLKLVADRNGRNMDADLKLVIHARQYVEVLTIGGELTPEERARVAAAEAPR